MIFSFNMLLEQICPLTGSPILHLYNNPNNFQASSQAPQKGRLVPGSFLTLFLFFAWPVYVVTLTYYEQSRQGVRNKIILVHN